MTESQLAEAWAPRPRSMTIQSKDIDRCPKRALTAGHYWPDGDCVCTRDPIAASSEQIERFVFSCSLCGVRKAYDTERERDECAAAHVGVKHGGRGR